MKSETDWDVVEVVVVVATVDVEVAVVGLLAVVAVVGVVLVVVCPVKVVHCSVGHVVLTVAPLGPPRYENAPTRVTMNSAAATAMTPMVRLLKETFMTERACGQWALAFSRAFTL